LTICFIRATIAREFSTPTLSNAPERPRLLFFRLPKLPYLLSFH